MLSLKNWEPACKMDTNKKTRDTLERILVYSHHNPGHENVARHNREASTDEDHDMQAETVRWIDAG